MTRATCGPYFSSSFLFSHTSRVLKPKAKSPLKKINAAQIDCPLTYRGPSDVGKIFVPSSGPHCPMTLRITMPVPRRVSEPWLSEGRLPLAYDLGCSSNIAYLEPMVGCWRYKGTLRQLPKKHRNSEHQRFCRLREERIQSLPHKTGTSAYSLVAESGPPHKWRR